MREHKFSLTGVESPLTAAIDPILHPNEVYDILVDAGVVEDEGHWGAMLSDRTRPFEGLTSDILGRLRNSLDDEFPDGLDADETVGFGGREATWDDEMLYEILSDAPAFDHGRYDQISVELKVALQDAATEIGDLAAKRLNQVLSTLGFSEDQEANKLSTETLNALFAGRESSGTAYVPRHLIGALPPPKPRPVPAPRAKAKAKKARVEAGGEYYVRIGNDYVKVVVTGEIPGSKPARYLARRLDTGRDLPKWRLGRELHETPGPW